VVRPWLSATTPFAIVPYAAIAMTYMYFDLLVAKHLKRRPRKLAMFSRSKR
jgi:hypothetical protein